MSIEGAREEALVAVVALKRVDTGAVAVVAEIIKIKIILLLLLPY